MAQIPLSPVFLKSFQFQTDDGHVAAFYRLYTYVAGTTTPTTLFTDSDGSTAADNPYDLNASGRTDDTLYLPNDTGVKIIFTTEDGPDSPTPIPPSDVIIATDDNIENPGAVAFANFGVLMTEVSQLGMDEAEQIDPETTYVTIDGTVNPTTIYMPSAALMRQPLTVLNVGANPAQLVRDGTDIWIGGGQTWDLAVGTSPKYTGAQFVSDGETTYRPTASW